MSFDAILKVPLPHCCGDNRRVYKGLFGRSFFTRLCVQTMFVNSAFSDVFLFQGTRFTKLEFILGCVHPVLLTQQRLLSCYGFTFVCLRLVFLGFLPLSVVHACEGSVELALNAVDLVVIVFLVLLIDLIRSEGTVTVA